MNLVDLYNIIVKDETLKLLDDIGMNFT